MTRLINEEGESVELSALDSAKAEVWYALVMLQGLDHTTFAFPEPRLIIDSAKQSLEAALKHLEEAP